MKNPEIGVATPAYATPTPATQESRPRKPKRTSSEIGKAVRRVRTECLLSVEELNALTGLNSRKLVRWTIEGTCGVHLDGFHRPGVGWLSSLPAVDRFLAQAIAAQEAAGGPERSAHLREVAARAAQHLAARQAPLARLARPELETLAGGLLALVVLLTTGGPSDAT